MDVASYVKNNSDSVAASEEQWTFVPILDRSIYYMTTEELAERWGFSFPESQEGTASKYLDMSIVDFLEQCAEWVETYGDHPNAPSIMPDYEFRVLKSVAFDVCGLTIADYQTGNVDFENATVKRILESLRTISSDIEDSGLGDQGIDEFEQDAYEAKRYLLYGGLHETSDHIKMISLQDVNQEYDCMYAIRWVAIPASSKNQMIGYSYIQALLSENVSQNGFNHNLAESYKTTPDEYQDPNSKDFNIVIPSTWQYALSDLFDSYYAGNMETDEFMNQVQKRLEVYITE